MANLVLVTYTNMKHMNKLKALYIVLGLLVAYPVVANGALGSSFFEQMRVGENVNKQADITVTADMIGAKEGSVNNATTEATEIVTGTGTLIEIGNTTAPDTTIIIRTTATGGASQDQTFEIDSGTKIVTSDGFQASLSDWIAGDPITFTARHYINSDELVATRLVNTTLRPGYKGINGWVTAVHLDTNKVDVLWSGNQTFTLNVANASMVVGTKNPASLADLQVGDRIRARVTDDNDGNPLTWNASILVVLRRGTNLFMRVTRWVVPATIAMIPQNLGVPMTIQVTVANSQFYQPGDVNNLIGPPGTTLMVDITSDTMLVRKYYGKALLSELSEGDAVRIIGRRDETTGHLVAQVIKDDSIQQLGVAYRLGAVTAIDNSAKTLTVVLFQTDNTNNTWTIHTNSSTAIYQGSTLGSWSDLTVGSAVRIRGIVNTAQTTIIANTIAVVSRASSM